MCTGQLLPLTQLCQKWQWRGTEYTLLLHPTLTLSFCNPGHWNCSVCTVPGIPYRFWHLTGKIGMDRCPDRFSLKPLHQHGKFLPQDGFSLFIRLSSDIPDPGSWKAALLFSRSQLDRASGPLNRSLLSPTACSWLN